MFTYKYTQKQIKISEENKKIKTTLEARFRFKDETSLIERKDLVERMYNREDLQNTLDEYLRQAEGVSEQVFYNRYIDSKRKRNKFTVKKRPCKIGIDIKISSDLDLKPEEMLNMKNLNHFILTGEYL